MTVKQYLESYKRIFSISEIEESLVLKWVFGATLLTFFITFASWIRSSALTVEGYLQNTHLCWPWFKSCGEWYFLQALPHGYSQATLYMLFFGIMLLVAYYMWKEQWVFAHMLMVVLFLWKFFVMFFYSGSFSANFDYYHIIFALILLFIPLKVFFLKLSVVVLYFLAVTIKFDDTWILGTYFTSLETGLPIFPDSITPLITGIVIFMQTVGVWFLLSSNKLLQRIALVYFVIFHLYSGILVEYRYPATVLPTLLILFGPLYTQTKVPLVKKALFGWIFIALLFIFQFISVVIPGDERLTLEGNNYGLYMFEANHQCISVIEPHYADGHSESFKRESANARSRCNPYNWWFRQQENCKRDTAAERISWTFDHSVNGGPFYRIVNVENVCELEYQAFRHNDWINTPEEGAPIVGWPVENYYR